MESSNSYFQIRDKKRGLLITIENMDLSESDINALEENIKNHTKLLNIKIIKFPDPSEKETKRVNEIKSQNLKMGKRAELMIKAMERWKMRETLLDGILNGQNYIIINYGFKDILNALDDYTNIAWAKTPYIGYIRPDLVLYLDTENHLFSNSYKNLFFMQNVKEAVTFKKDKIQNQLISEIALLPYDEHDVNNDIKNNIVNHINKVKKIYDFAKNNAFEHNFYPSSIGEDLFMHGDN